MLFQDPTQTIKVRVADLVAKMTLQEKISQMLHTSPAVERLGIPTYNWWNEALHGVARAGIATVFPQAIGLAATWNADLMLNIATAISDEARAKHHEAVRNGERGWYQGLTFWSPNINIFRDPRWGRGQETYGEDPYLTARMGVNFVRGLQGDDPHYLKLVATPKHFAVHSGPEADRHGFDAIANQRDLWETYLPAFEATVVEANAESVMGAYNRTNGEPCCASPTLLQSILREKWGFTGYVVSDCGAIGDIYRHHQVVATAAEAAALAVKNGCELNCGETYPTLLDAVAQGLISEVEIDVAVKRLFMARFRLGMFDPPEQVPYANIPFSVVDSAENRLLALQTAQQSIVLLKNQNDFLPLPKNFGTIAVIGPNAHDPELLLGNYNGTPSVSVTPLRGIQAKVGDTTRVLYAQGCDVIRPDQSGFAAAIQHAESADVVIFCAGLSQRLEGEEGEEVLGEGWDEVGGGDRPHIDLPNVQQQLLQALYETGTPIVLVLLNGSALAVNWADRHLPAILEAWYPGEEGGTAIADVLFGDYNPAGRLPVTFYKSIDGLPLFADYSMENRTYRYFNGSVLYPFGYGLSYTKFVYRNLTIDQDPITLDDDLTITIDVTNIGDRAGDEVTQLYVTHANLIHPAPIRQLCGFQRNHLQPNETRTVRFSIKPRQIALANDYGERVVVSSTLEFSVGGGQPFTGASYILRRVNAIPRKLLDDVA